MSLTINHQTNDISATSGSVTIDGAASSFNSSTSWASVSRTSGTTYTNSLSYPIMFKVTGGLNQNLTVYVNGVLVHNVTAAYSNYETACVIVPPSKTYSYSGSSIRGTWILS